MKSLEDDRNHSCFSPHLWIKSLQVQLVFLLGPERHLDDHQESKNANYQGKREKRKKKDHVASFSVCFCEDKRAYGKVCSLLCGQRQVNPALALSLAVADMP